MQQNPLAFSLSVRPTIYVSRAGAQVTITWTGTSVLQSSASPAGPYSTLVGAASPYSVNQSGPAAQFYRLKD